MLKYFLTAASGVVVGFIAGIFFEKLLKKIEEKRIVESKELLFECFGEPLYSSTFYFEDVTNWIEGKKDRILAGDKVAVIKTSEKLVEKYCSNIRISHDIDNYLIMTIISTDNKMSESILVKFEKLDSKLLDLLDKGDGILIVEN